MLRKFLAGLSAMLLTAGLVTVIGGAASAHTPSASADCSAVTVSLTNYDASGVNHVKVTQAGAVTYDADFGATYQAVLPFADATKVNTWKVEVTAWDDATGSKGYTKTFERHHKEELCTRARGPQGSNLPRDLIAEPPLRQRQPVCVVVFSRQRLQH